MQDVVKYFNDNKYVHLTNFISKDVCKDLTKELNKCIQEGKTTKDTQCPISEAMYGGNVFDQVLLDTLPHIEKVSGKRLYPTYSYARLYKPGEELLIHSDREACEISATITLGKKGKDWSIFMADRTDKEEEAEPYNSKAINQFKDIKVKNISEVKMDVGDVVIYYGKDKVHWREKFEGKWQAQLFLHYVDADGPYKEWKYDKRSKLGVNRTVSLENDNQKQITNYAIFENHLTDSFCQSLIKTYSQDTIEKQPPTVGGGGYNNTDGIIDRSVRNVDRVILPQNQGIGSALTATGLNANHYWWKYDITHSNQTEFLMYNPEGHYVSHVDTFHYHGDNTRKLTVVAFLNDDFEGGKFFINAAGAPVYPPQEKGTVIVFPSYMVHGVEPVTKGIRYSCVTWLLGPYFK